MKAALTAVVRWAIILSLPILLCLSVARALFSDAYLRYEYGKPDFPPDSYGFTQAQRLELASVAIAFLNRPEPADQAVALLAAQRMPGTDQPLYTFYELSHMVDVKNFTDKLWRLHIVAGILVIGGMALLLLRRATRLAGYEALLFGGLLTGGLLTALAVFVLVSWRTFFIQFHELFFAPGTWIFNWEDSLIRLFPDRFWSDAGIIVSAGTLVAGIVVAGVGYAAGKRLKTER